MAHGISAPTEVHSVPRGSKRLLALRADEHLVDRVRRGDEAAFEVIYERHVPGVLSFCRHMLGSREEAEDAVQHAFTAAHSALLRDEREIRLKPWLYAIARNRCLSILRARREQADDNVETSTIGLDAEVERRADLRQLVEDLQDLPPDQREALVLSELKDLSHGEVAEVLGCEVANVKGLVFRARTGLSERREARDASCQAIQEELSTAQGGTLRRGRLRHHLRSCEPCTSYLEEVRRQRKMIAAILPVIPTVGLKHSVFAAVGAGGASGAAAGGGAATGGGALAGLTTAGGATVAKVAVIGALVAGGGGVVGQAVLDHGGSADSGSEVSPRIPAGAPSGPPIGRLDPAGAAKPEVAEPARPTKGHPGKSRKGEKTKSRQHGSSSRGRSGDAPANGRGRGPAAAKPDRRPPQAIAPQTQAPLRRRFPIRPTVPQPREGTVVPPRPYPVPAEPPAPGGTRRLAPDG